MKKTQALFIITQYIFTRKAFLVFPFSVVWSMFNDWFDDIRTAGRVSTLREKSRSLQRLTLHFARQTTFWFLESILSIQYFPRNWEGEYEESVYSPWSQTRVQLPPDGLWEVMLCSLYPRSVKTATSQKNEGLCLYLLCLSSLLGELDFFKLISASFACHCFGLLPCFLGRSLEWLIAPEAGDENSMVVKSAVQPLSAEDQAHK